MSEIVVIGSLNADLVVTAERAPEGGETVSGIHYAVHNGGKGANQAFAAARLGGQVTMLGRVGNDDYGRQLLASLQSQEVDTRFVRCINGTTTGVAAITVETSGENRIVVVPGANGAYDTSELLRGIEALSGAKLCLFQLEIPLETVHRGLLAARERGCVTILDPAPAQILSTDLLATVDILTPNLSELSILSQTPLDDETPLNKVESAAGRLLSMGVGKVLAKLGARGALLVDESGVSFAQALPVQATDSTAAGDCFNGALAAALARGESALEATQFACAAAALSVTREGAQSSIPSLEEVIRFMASPLRQPRGA